MDVCRLRSGGLVAVSNEERFPYHHDSGRTVMLRSGDEGETWTDRTVVSPYTDTTGNRDCGICELGDGTVRRATRSKDSTSSRARQRSVSARPRERDDPFGDHAGRPRP